MQPLCQRQLPKLNPWITGIVVMGGMPLGLIPKSVMAIPMITPEAVAERLSGLLVYQLEGERQIHMTTCPVLKPGSATDNLYLYQEQARDDKLDQPYRQRLLSLEAIAPNQVASVSYRLADEANWIGFCQKDLGDRLVTDQDLLPAHCTVTLQAKGKKFIGTTPEQGCVSNYRGAAFVHNRVVLTPTGMKTYDQGFDEHGHRVWGSDGTPYIFKKVLP